MSTLRYIPLKKKDRDARSSGMTISERLQVVYEIGADMAAIRNLPDLVELVLKRVQSDLHFQEASLYTRRDEKLYFLGAASVRSDNSPQYKSMESVAHRGEETFAIPFGRGVTGWAASHGGTVYVPDVSQDERYIGKPPPGQKRNHSELAMPLLIGEKVIGLLNIEDAEVDAFTLDDQKVLGLLAELVCIALENIRLHDEARSHIRELADINARLSDEVTQRKEAEESLLREFQLRESEHAVRLQVASMEQPEDVVKVGQSIMQELEKLNVRFDSFSMQLVIRDGTDFISIWPDRPASFNRFLKGDFDRKPPGNAQKHPWVLEVWKTGEVRHQPCVPEGHLGLSGKSLIDVPFSQGTLALNVETPNIFTDNDIGILRRFADVLSESFKRFYDLIQSKDALAALEESEKRLSLVLDATHEGVWDWNIGTGRVYFSPYWIESLGYAPEDVSFTLEFWAGLVHPDDMPRAQALLTAHFEGKTPIYECRTRLLTKSGEWRWNLDRGKVVEWDENGDPLRMVGTDTDITEQHQLEEQLLQSQKMEAIGRLAGGVAHDFNNLLTIINGYGDIILNSEQLDEALRTPAEEIFQAGERAASLTAQLLAFSRRQIIQPGLFDLNRIITDNVRMLQRLIGEDVKLITRLDASPMVVEIDLGQINQIIMNLVVNARDAMPTGGVLTIDTDSAVLDEAYCLNHPDANPGRYVRLRIQDTGSGIDPESKAHIFEPFFTTKSTDQGTGLGLSTVYGIVQQNGGSIWVDSEAGEGAVFTIYLPEADADIIEPPEPNPESDMQSGAETVLLVEDDNHVRRLLNLALTEAGYTVLEAGNGVEALEKVAQFSDTIHLLITDIVMPQMNGRELKEQLADLHPETNVLYISGYTDDILEQYELTDVPFLQKPFTSNKLIQRVKQMLSGPSNTHLQGV